MNAMRVLLTRAEPAASHTAERLRDAGYEPVVFPLFEIRDTGLDMPEGSFDGIILTSKNAVHVLESRQWRPGHGVRTAFCVGDKTLEAAQGLGLPDCHSADGDAEALAGLIRDYYAGNRSRLLYPAAADRSFDMAAALQPCDIDVAVVAIYEVVPLVVSSHDRETVCNAIDGGVALGYSRRTVRRLAELLFANPADRVLPKVTLLAISEGAAESVLKYPWQDVYVAKAANENALFEELSKL